MSEAVQGAIVGGLIGIVSTLIGSRAERRLQRRGRLLYENTGVDRLTPGQCIRVVTSFVAAALQRYVDGCSVLGCRHRIAYRRGRTAVQAQSV